MLTLVRVDNRLIHGQVATGWISKSGASKIVVVDDKSASSEMLQDVLALATPPSIKLDIYSVKDAAEKFKADGFGEMKVFVIFKSIPAAYDAYNLGLTFDELQIGGTANGAGRKVIEGAISLDQREAEMLDELEKKGVHITLQQTVQSHISSWSDVARKLKF